MSSSVSAPSVVSQTVSAMADGLVEHQHDAAALVVQAGEGLGVAADHVTRSQPPGLRGRSRDAIAVSVKSNQLRQISRANHFASSGQVLVRSWCSVLAVSVSRESWRTCQRPQQ